MIPILGGLAGRLALLTEVANELPIDAGRDLIGALTMTPKRSLDPGAGVLKTTCALVGRELPIKVQSRDLGLAETTL